MESHPTIPLFGRQTGGSEFKVSLGYVRPWAYVGGGWANLKTQSIIPHNYWSQTWWTHLQPKWLGGWGCRVRSSRSNSTTEHCHVSKPQEEKSKKLSTKCWNDHFWVHHQVLFWFFNFTSSGEPGEEEATHYRQTPQLHWLMPIQHPFFLLCSLNWIFAVPSSPEHFGL